MPDRIPPPHREEHLDLRKKTSDLGCVVSTLIIAVWLYGLAVLVKVLLL